MRLYTGVKNIVEFIVDILKGDETTGTNKTYRRGNLANDRPLLTSKQTCFPDITVKGENSPFFRFVSKLISFYVYSINANNGTFVNHFESMVYYC